MRSLFQLRLDMQLIPPPPKKKCRCMSAAIWGNLGDQICIICAVLTNDGAPPI